MSSPASDDELDDDELDDDDDVEEEEMFFLIFRCSWWCESYSLLVAVPISRPPFPPNQSVGSHAVALRSTLT